MLLGKREILKGHFTPVYVVLHPYVRQYGVVLVKEIIDFLDF